MKIILLPYIRALATVPHIAGQLVGIIESFSSLSSITQVTYASSVGYLGQLIRNENVGVRFPLSFIATLQDEVEVVVD